MMRRMALFAVAGLLAAPGGAAANGRFPASVNVETRPADTETILLPVTFGLLVSTDDGASFQWMCEESIGYGGTYDPDYALSADGTIWATTFTGLRVTRDGGCTWTTVGGAIDGKWIDEVEVGPTGAVWVATASGGESNDVYVSVDGVAPFESVGLESDEIWWKTVRVAPGDPKRAYVTGYQVTEAPLPGGGTPPPTAVLKRTDDGGETWVDLPLGDFEFSSQPQLFMLGALPTNPDIAFARVQGAVENRGDAVFRTIDAGQSWARVVEFDDALTAFAIAEQGERLIAGTIDDGVRVSTDLGVTWEAPATEPRMACVGERSDGDLFACGANWDPDNFTLGRSTDGGDTWTKVVRFSEIAAPVKCGGGTVQFDTCESLIWPSIVQQFGIGQADAGPVSTDTTGDGDGDGDTSGSTDSGSTDDSTTTTTGGPGGGCGCRAAGGGTSALLFAAGTLALLGRRRRRRR